MIFQKFPGYFDKLVNCQPVQCLDTKKSFDVIRKPTAVVLDVGIPYFSDHAMITHCETLVFPASRFSAYSLGNRERHSRIRMGYFI
jgi:hypothetical protein